MTIEQVIAGIAAFLAVLVLGFLQSRRAPADPGAPHAPGTSQAAFVPASVRRSLSLAGIDDPARQRWFAVAVAGAVAAGAGCGYAAAWYLDVADSPGVVLGTVAVGIYLLVQVPFGWLASRVAAYRLEILTDFTVMLDLLQIAVEGGMGLAAAWATVTDAIGRRGGALAAEMRRVDVQVGLGASWPKALHDSSERTGVAEFGALGSLLGQAERFGTEVGRAIRVQCDAMRHEEVESIEERAHRASVKVVIPLVGLLLPATILVTFVPLLIIVIGALADVSPD
ncbi:MAG: type II secretion system F family protein [Phycisphaerales bacterium]